MRDKLLPALAAGLLLAGPAQAACYPSTDAKPLEPELVIDGGGGTFWDSFRKVVVEPFEKECGVKVTITLSPQRTFAQLEGLVTRRQVPWDISFTNSPYEFATGIQRNLFEPFPAGFWDPIRDKLVDRSYNEYGTWLSSYANIIVWNTRTFPNGGPQNWADFFDTQKFPGARSMQNHPISIVMALLADGVKRDEVYPIDDAKYRRAFARLDQLRPNLRTFWSGPDQPVQGTHRGDFAMAAAYSGRAAAGVASKYDIGIAWGDNVFNDVWLFRPRGARHPLAAAALLYWFNDAGRQAQMAELTGYSGGVKGVAAMLPPQTEALLATSPEHLAMASVVNADWWRDNGARAQSLWQEWVTTGKVTLGP